MNREQKLIFIKTHHPNLYKLVEEHVGNRFLENPWGADANTLTLYNCWISFYCGQFNDVKLMNMLMI